MINCSTREIPSTLLFWVTQRGKVHDPVDESVMDDVNKQKRKMKKKRK